MEAGVSRIARAILRGEVDLTAAMTVDIDPILFIKPMAFPGMTKPLSTSKPIVLVLVEARLLDTLPAPALSSSKLEDRLRQFHVDLEADGFDSRTLSVGMRRGAGHRDGEGVLALRELFQDLHTTHPNLAGAILIGSFPEATLVRRWIWRRPYKTTTLAGVVHQDVDLLYIVPEVIAERSDLVLSDLDGNWDQLYEPGPVDLAGIRALPDPSVGPWPTDGGLFTSSKFERRHDQFEDFFLIHDDDFDEISAPDSDDLVLRLWLTGRNPECAAADLTQPNPIARPEIAVSRINPRNVAVVPDPTYTDVNGQGFLDPSGVPQAVEAPSPILEIWKQDAAFERRLLIDYFDRNHRFRRGDYYFSFSSFRAAAIASSSFGATGLASSLEKASPAFAASVVAEASTVLEFVQWLKDPAILRGVTTHAAHTLTQFDQVDYQVADLEAEIGGQPWRWVASQTGSTITYTPSLAHQGVHADLRLYRSLWENQTLASNPPSFILHDGCHVNSPLGARTAPYDSPHYAPFQEAESQLFYLDGLAYVARAKEFNDSVSFVFAPAFGAAGARFGDGLAAYFGTESSSANLGKFENSVEAKRTYWWSMLGDWTLHLRYTPSAVVTFEKPLAANRPLLHDKWLITDGYASVKVLPDEGLADGAKEVIDAYGMTERYVIGGEETGWEYYLADGVAPRTLREPAFRENWIEFGADELSMDVQRGVWVVRAGREQLARLANRAEAEAVLGVLQHHEATALCWIGEREAPAMTYFTTRP